MQSQFVGHFGGTHGVGQILLVGKDEQNGVAEFVFVEHSVQFIAGGVDTIRVIGIDNKDESLSVLVVVAPQGTDFILTTDIPNCERNVLVFDGFDIETNRRDGRDDCKLSDTQNRLCERKRILVCGRIAFDSSLLVHFPKTTRLVSTHLLRA